jgi:hypothetical protein
LLSGSKPVERLRAVCLGHLRTRIAQPLEAPRDWRRSSALACDCRDCAELGRFLADAERRVWSFKAAESKRVHVSATVARARCDLDLTTKKRGSPHTLVCTKNQASYDRRARQRVRRISKTYPSWINDLQANSRKTRLGAVG